MNVLRQKPKVYLKHLEEYIDGFSNGCLNIPGIDYGLHLEEGKKVVSILLFTKFQQNDRILFNIVVGG